MALADFNREIAKMRTLLEDEQATLEKHAAFLAKLRTAGYQWIAADLEEFKAYNIDTQIYDHARSRISTLERERREFINRKHDHSQRRVPRQLQSFISESIAYENKKTDLDKLDDLEIEMARKLKKPRTE